MPAPSVVQLSSTSTAAAYTVDFEGVNTSLLQGGPIKIFASFEYYTKPKDEAGYVINGTTSEATITINCCLQSKTFDGEAVSSVSVSDYVLVENETYVASNQTSVDGNVVVIAGDHIEIDPIFVADATNGSTFSASIPTSYSCPYSGNRMAAAGWGTADSASTAPPQILGLSDPTSMEHTVSLSPNPSNGFFNVLTGNTNLISRIGVYDLVGQEVFTTQEKSNALDLTFLSSGSYFVRIYTNDGKMQMQKIVISH